MIATRRTLFVVEPGDKLRVWANDDGHVVVQVTAGNDSEQLVVKMGAQLATGLAGLIEGASSLQPRLEVVRDPDD